MCRGLPSDKCASTLLCDATCGKCKPRRHKRWAVRTPRLPPRNSTPVALAQELLRRRKSLQLVQIGAHFGDFNKSQWHSGVGGDSARRVVHTLLENQRTRALLLEPNPSAFTILQAGVHARSSSLPATTAVNAAVCPNTTGTVDFYVVSRRFLQEFPNAPYWAQSELSTTVRSSILRGVHLVVRPKDPELYVEKIRVPCYRPDDLLRMQSVDPRSVDALVVDAEGLDANLVEAFMNGAGVQPALIIFEAHIADAQSLRVLYATLRRGGYKLDCCGCATWVVANSKDPLTARDLMNASKVKKCDSGRNAVAWDPRQLDLSVAVARSPGLQAWYERIGGA